MQPLNEIKAVAPALEKYALGPVAELWKRPGLSVEGSSPMKRGLKLLDEGPWDGVEAELKSLTQRRGG